MSLIDDYFNLQKEYEEKYGMNTILFIEKGMFYEIYEVNNNDEKIGKATIVSQLLNIQLTKMNKKIEQNNRQNPLMTGFPVASIKKNVKILIDNSYTIVTYDQQNDPSNRKITQIYSPGTYIENSKSLSNYICCIYIDQNESIYESGISFIELSTGESHVYYFITDDNVLIYENINRIIESYNAKEYIIVLENIKERNIERELNTNTKLIHYLKNENITLEYQNEVLKKIFSIESQLSSIEYLDLENVKYGCVSYIYLLQFCYEHNESVLNNIEKPKVHTDDDKLILHNNALYQINIVSTKSKEKGITCLLDIIDNTNTPMGKRLLKKMVLNPIANKEILEKQYNEINEMIPKVDWYESKLRAIIDIERIQRKICTKTIKPNELANLQNSYENINIILSQQIYNNKKVYETFSEYYKFYITTFNFALLKDYNNENINENIFNIGIFEEIDNIQKSIEKYYKSIELECKKIKKILYSNWNIILKMGM